MVRYERHVRLERRADWLVLAMRLVLLRSRLLLPSTPELAGAAQSEAKRELPGCRTCSSCEPPPVDCRRGPSLGRMSLRRHGASATRAWDHTADST